MFRPEEKGTFRFGLSWQPRVGLQQPGAITDGFIPYVVVVGALVDVILVILYRIRIASLCC
jgi:hypothetical protein